MRINMSRWLIAVASIVIIGCSSGYIVVNGQTWSKNYTTPYPFTVPEGEIMCGFHPAFGREVYFQPEGYTDESYIGTPLNKSAVNSLKQSNMSASLPHSVKEEANLNEVV